MNRPTFPTARRSQNALRCRDDASPDADRSVACRPARRQPRSRPAKAAAGADTGSAGSHEPRSRRAHQKSLAECGADRRQQLRRPRRIRARRNQRCRRTATLGRLGIRDRRRRLHHDERARRQRRAARADHPAAGQRRWHPGHGAVGQEEYRERADRRPGHRARSRAAEGGRAEAAGAAAGYVHGSSAGRDGVRVWQPERPAQQPHPRADFFRRPAGRSRLSADLRSDRRADQPRESGGRS